MDFPIINHKVTERPLKFLDSILLTGTKELEEDQSKKVRLVNILSLVTASLAFFIGNIFIAFVGRLEIGIPATIESIFFLSVIILNKNHKYAAASLSIMLIHCCSLLYFGVILGPTVNLSLIAVFLLSISLFLYSDIRLKILSASAAALTLYLLEVNFYNGFVQPISLSKPNQHILRWLAMASFATFDTILITNYIRENKALLRRVKMFYFKISHEIRNQLHTITLVGQLLKREIKLDENLKKIEPLVDLLLSAAHSMRNIINNVLDMAQIEAGKVEKAELEPFLLRSFIKKVINLNKVRATTRGIKILATVGPEMPDILISDTLILNQVLTNLLGNAVKYADKNSIVTCNIFKANSRLCISVTNQCPDIDSKRQLSLFNMFTTERRNKQEGSGLGLFITKAKVNALEGTIQLQSKEGKTTFTVTLPLLEGNEKDLIREVEEADIDLSNVNFLIADDNEMSNMLLSNLLRSYDCNVTKLSSGKEVMDYLGNTKKMPDGIILDHEMPGLSGEQTLIELKKSPLLERIPVIMITGKAEYEKQLLTAGAVAVILKPIDPKSLFEVISQHLTHIGVDTGLV